MHISTIIPVYNNEHYLPEAVASVMMQRSVMPRDVTMDVWIVDDGSTDRTPQVANGLAGQDSQSSGVAVTVLRQANAGAAAARNYGAASSRGDLLAFLDSDDLWTEGRLAWMFAALEADPALDVVFGYVEQFISPELSAQEQARLICPTELIPGYHPSGMLIRRTAFEQVGGYDPQWAHGEIIDWYLRLKEAGLKERLLSQVVFRRRIHGANSVLKPFAQQAYPRVLRAALARRRARAAQAGHGDQEDS